MGRRNKSYSKDLHQQAYERLKGMQSFGESKKAAMDAGTNRDKIFSANTYKSYWKHIKYFIKYIRENHPECTTLKSAKKYVNEWLQTRAIKEIPYDRVNRGTGRRYQSEVYVCRKDEAGKRLDKAAMLVCSKALGHNRISVVADNYIRGL